MSCDMYIRVVCLQKIEYSDKALLFGNFVVFFCQAFHENLLDFFKNFFPQPMQYGLFRKVPVSPYR